VNHAFTDFKITHVPRAMNELVESLVVSAYSFIPSLHPKLNYEVQVMYRPSHPNNVKFWKVFEDGVELTKFLTVIDEFSYLQIDLENEHDEEDEKRKLRSKIGAHEIVQLSNNQIPKGLVPLESLFDNNDVAVKLEKKEEDSNVFQFNVANEQDPKYVNLASHLSE
jgi:hypothetical protein